MTELLNPRVHVGSAPGVVSPSAPTTVHRSVRKNPVTPEPRSGVTDTLASWRDRWRTATAEQALSDFWTDYVDQGERSLAHLVRRPLASATAVAAMAKLPSLHATLPDTHEGREVHWMLTRPGLLRTPFGRTGAAVLEVPTDPAEYSLGASRQTLRRKARSATKQGITWRPVDDPTERLELLALANRMETEHSDATYRNDSPDNRDLLDLELWLAAFGPDGTPVLLSVTATAGDWALMRYFRRLGNERLHSDTRYLMTQVLVESLARRGVRHVFEGTHPAGLPNGLRHFQRMVGFRMARVTAALAPAAAAARPAQPGSAGKPVR